MYIKPVEEKKVTDLARVRPVNTNLPPALPQQPYFGTPGSLPPAYQDTTIDPREIAAKIWRGKWIILATVIISLLLTLVFIKSATPKYTARALVMIGGNHKLDIDLNGTSPTLQVSNNRLYNEFEVLRSPMLAKKVFQQLELQNQPEYNPYLQPSDNMLHKFMGSLRSILPFLDDADVNNGIPRVNDEQKEASMIDRFLDSQTLQMLDKSEVISVQFTAPDPLLASKITNTYIDKYLEDQIDSKFEVTSKANDWLDTRVNNLRQKVKEAETSVEEYRKNHGLLQTSSGNTVYSQQLSELNTQMTLASTERAEKEARLNQARALGSSSGSASEILGSATIQSLRQQEATIDLRLAELSTSYGDKHPSVVNVKAEKRDIQNKIAIETRKILKGLENEANIARSRESALRSRMRTLESQLAGSNTQEVKLRALEREAEASRNLLNTFLARYNETDSQKDRDIQQPDSKVVSYASPPTTPSFPKAGPILGLALFGSIIFGLINVLLKELFDKGFRSGVQTEQHTGLPSLGIVPALSRIQSHLAKPESYVLKFPSSDFSESIRSVYTNMLFTRHDERAPRVVQFTSAYPGEGKSTIARCLAILKRQAGVKTIIIDANIRKPTLHKSFNTVKQPGLAEYLSGMATVHEVIAKDKKSGAYLIPAGQTKRSPTDLLPSRRINDLFDDLLEDFDLIIVDSPPVLTVPDARILASRVDMSVVVIKWADTREDVVEYALKQLSESGAPRLSTVLSRVNTKKHSQYSYADSGLYSGNMN